MRNFNKLVIFKEEDIISHRTCTEPSANLTYSSLSICFLRILEPTSILNCLNGMFSLAGYIVLLSFCHGFSTRNMQLSVSSMPSKQLI